MRLTIEHETHYRFGAPAHHSIQYLRLTPRADPCQSVISWQISTPGKLKRWIDGYGNPAHVSVQNGLHDEVAVVTRGEVQTFDTCGMLPAEDGLPPGMFLRETTYTGLNDAIIDFAAPFRQRVMDEGPIAALHALMLTLHTAVAYKPRTTDVHTTAAAALEQGEGVCQDHAHLFIACCRVLNIPARYVSGYLVGRGDHAKSLATHAWAEAYVEDKDTWISFDPTHCLSATEEYVRLAIAFDYAGACPVRGMRQGGGLEEMTVRVQITPTQ
jgi:transglutaminase-like putative cysteine protease